MERSEHKAFLLHLGHILVSEPPSYDVSVSKTPFLPAFDIPPHMQILNNSIFLTLILKIRSPASLKYDCIYLLQEKMGRKTKCIFW